MIEHHYTIMLEPRGKGRPVFTRATGSARTPETTRAWEHEAAHQLREPDLVALAPRITCPVLYLRGDQEPADLYPAEAFARRAGGPCAVEIVRNCDHYYVGREDAVASTVATWLGRMLGLQA